MFFNIRTYKDNPKQVMIIEDLFKTLRRAEDCLNKSDSDLIKLVISNEVIQYAIFMLKELKKS